MGCWFLTGGGAYFLVVHRTDDLNDAFAALWTARRIANGTAQVFGDRAPDKFGLRMEMWA